MNVQQLYNKYLLEGKTKKDAAKLAQEETGMSVVTGKPIDRRLPYKEKYSGQYRIP